MCGHSAKIIFSEKMGLPMFPAVMSLNKFQFLISYLCLDDTETRKERWKNDRFAAFRDIFELFNDNCAKH